MASTIPVEATDGDSSSDKGLTIEVLKEHSTRDSMYLLLHDKVYDVTKFMDEHPGGDEVMLEEAGRDATEAFEDVGHSDEARDMLPKMLIGEFKGEKSAKNKVAAARSTSTSSPSSSSSFPIWVVPATLFAAYIAWRVLYA